MSEPWKRRVEIGPHVMFEGDAREVLPTLGGIECLVTDPPYGMSFRSNHRLVKHREIENDGDAALLKFACEFPVSHSAYVWMRWDNLSEVPMPRSLITWVKNNHSMGDLEHEHGRQTEVCAFYKGPQHYFPKGRPTDVVFGTRTGNEFHPTQKPIDLMCNVIGWTAGTVVDPFMGSGTTGVACVREGRRFVGIELDPGYFDIACARIEREMRQPRLDLPAPPKPEQETMQL